MCLDNFIMISLFLQIFYSIFSGFMEALSIGNEIFHFGSPFLALFCLVPLYIAIRKCKSYRQAFFVFFLQAITVHIMSSFWLKNFRDFAIFTLGASALGEGIIAGLCGIFSYSYFANETKQDKFQQISGSLFYKNFFNIFWFTITWVFWEWMKSTGFLAYPWGTLFLAAYKWKFITQIASVTGVWGITFLFAFINGILGEIILNLRNIKISPTPYRIYRNLLQNSILAAVLTGTTLVFGIFQYFYPRTPSKYVNTVIVQQNSDPWESDEIDDINKSIALTRDAVKEMKREGMRPDLVLWSEGILSHSMPQSRSYYKTSPKELSLSSFIEEIDTPFIIGGQGLLNSAKRHYGNAAILFDSRGNYSGFYCKQHLVPFAEEIPYLDNPIVKTMLKKLLGFSNGWTKGNQTLIFQIPIRSAPGYPAPLEYSLKPVDIISLNKDGSNDSKQTEKWITNKGYNPDSNVRFSTPICFEDAFPDVCSKLFKAGSEVFMNITNDSWSKTVSAEYQHFIAASYRAIEYRTTLVRSTNSGYSAIVGPNGKILKDLPLFEACATGFAVPVYPRKFTVYAYCGDWFAYLCFLFIAILYAKYLWEIYLKNSKLLKKFKPVTIIIVKNPDNIYYEKTYPNITDISPVKYPEIPVKSNKKSPKPKAQTKTRKIQETDEKPAKTTAKTAKTVKTAAKTVKTTVKTAKAKAKTQEKTKTVKKTKK